MPIYSPACRPLLSLFPPFSSLSLLLVALSSQFPFSDAHVSLLLLLLTPFCHASVTSPRFLLVIFPVLLLHYTVRASLVLTLLFIILLKHFASVSTTLLPRSPFTRSFFLLLQFPHPSMPSRSQFYSRFPTSFLFSIFPPRWLILRLFSVFSLTVFSPLVTDMRRIDLGVALWSSLLSVLRVICFLMRVFLLV